MLSTCNESENRLVICVEEAASWKDTSLLPFIKRIDPFFFRTCIVFTKFFSLRSVPLLLSKRKDKKKTAGKRIRKEGIRKKKEKEDTREGRKERNKSKKKIKRSLSDTLRFQSLLTREGINRYFNGGKNSFIKCFWTTVPSQKVRT